MTELLFIVKEDESGFTARAVGESIVTEADTNDELVQNVQEAVRTYFDRPDETPKVIHLHYVRDETIPMSDKVEAGTDRYPLRGTVLAYVDPFEPACSAEDWEAMR
jgi:uncharacterized protein YqgV (UPF0045/DUF77 family)